MQLRHVVTGPAQACTEAAERTWYHSSTRRLAGPGAAATALCALLTCRSGPTMLVAPRPTRVQDASSRSMHLSVCGGLAPELAPAKTRVWQPDELCWPLMSKRYKAALHVLVQASHGVHRCSLRAAGMVIVKCRPLPRAETFSSDPSTRGRAICSYRSAPGIQRSMAVPPTAHGTSPTRCAPPLRSRCAAKTRPGPTPHAFLPSTHRWVCGPYTAGQHTQLCKPCSNMWTHAHAHMAAYRRSLGGKGQNCVTCGRVHIYGVQERKAYPTSMS